MRGGWCRVWEEQRRAQRPSARGVARRTAGYSTVLSLCYWTNDRQRPPGPPIAQPWPCEFGNGVGTDLPQHSWPFTRHTSVSSQLSAHSHAVSLSLNSTVSALVIYITPHKLPQAPPAGSLSCYRTTVMSCHICNSQQTSYLCYIQREFIVWSNSSATTKTVLTCKEFIEHYWMR